MKIGIVTIHQGLSYGSVGQAYALYTFLRRRLNQQPELINFLPWKEFFGFYPWLKITSLKEFIRFIAYVYQLPRKLNKTLKFTQFKNRHLSYSARYTEYSEVVSKSNVYDVLLSGSDQVLRASKPDKMYRFHYLDFSPSNTRRLMYAGSFGRVYIPEDRKQEVRDLLQKFNALSCREDEASDLVQQVAGFRPEVVLDPVHLLSPGDWRIIAKPVKRIKGEYILVYMLLRHEKVMDIAKRIKELTNLKIVLLDASVQSKYKADTIVTDAGMEEFVWLFDNARYVVTNSFHGTSFSVIFGKPFFSYNIPEPGFIVRSQSFLARIGCQDRIISDASEVSEANLNIDYDSIDLEYQKHRALSITFLKQHIGEAR